MACLINTRSPAIRSGHQLFQGLSAVVHSRKGRLWEERFKSVIKAHHRFADDPTAGFDEDPSWKKLLAGSVDLHEGSGEWKTHGRAGSAG
jgi:hypothetical protein